MNDELKRCREVVARYNALEDARTAQILGLAGSGELCGVLLASLHADLQRSGSMDRPSLTDRL